MSEPSKAIEKPRPRMTPYEVSRKLDCSVRHVANLRKRNQISAIDIAERGTKPCYRFCADSVDRFIRSSN